MISTILRFAIPALAIILVLVLLTMGYVKAPPDTAYLISGLRKKTVIGKASVRIPFFERIDRVSLKLIPIDVKTSSAVPTADYINIRVDAVVNVKVSDETDKLKLAAQNFLNQPPEYIAQVAKENNAELSVKRFVRFETGEGLEKKNEDLAAEVAAQLG